MRRLRQVRPAGRSRTQTDPLPLAGRAQIAAVVPDLAADSRAALSLLADFFHTPAEALAPPETDA